MRKGKDKDTEKTKPSGDNNSQKARPEIKGELPPDTTEVKSSPLDRLCEKLTESDKVLVEKIREEIDALRKLLQERDEYLKLLQRVQADFINYQNRVKRERESWKKYQAEEIIKELLPAFDNLMHSVQVKCVSEEAECLRKGIELGYREILRLLEKNGITLIKTLGQEFNPAVHEAIGNIESSDEIPGTIIKEVRPGFMLHERVLRPAQVVVATAPPPHTPAPNSEGEVKPEQNITSGKHQT